jgi:CspA family cold shock protein
LLAAPAIAAPQANATPVIAAPVTATPATEASRRPDVAVDVPATEVRRQGEPATRARDHGGRRDSARRRGTVKWFSGSKGYGFIRDDDGLDIFVHASAVADAGFRTLVQGQVVEYEVQRSAKGLHAVSITAPGAVTLRSA